MPRKYDRDNKGTPFSRTSAPAVRGRTRHGPADFAPELVLRREAVAISLSPRPVVLLSFSRRKSSVSLGFRLNLFDFFLFGGGAGTGISARPRTEPYGRLSRIRLPPWVADGWPCGGPYAVQAL